VANFVVTGVDGDDDGAVGVGGAAGIGVVGEAVLGAERAVDAIEDGAKFLGRVRVEHGAAGGVGHGFEGVFAGGVPAAFIFHRANDDGVEERVGEDGFFAGGIEVGAAGGFARVGNEDDDAAAIIAAAPEGAGAEEHGIIDGSACASGNPADGGLQIGDVIGKRGDLGDVLVEAEDREAVTGAQHLTNEVGGSFLFEGNFLVGAEARVNHDGEVQRLKSFGFELIDFLLDALFEELEGFEGKIGRGTIVLVEDADEHVDEVDGDADAPALCGGILRVGGRSGRRRGLNDFPWFAGRR